MAPFRMLSFTFLLLNALSDIQAGDNCLSCPKTNIAELGKDIRIICKSIAPITFMALNYCSLNGNHFTSKGAISEQNGTLSDDETTLEIRGNMAFLTINQIMISHEGNYTLKPVTKKCMNILNISLKVFAPYTEPEVLERGDSLICTASGGYPEEKLYWVSKTEANLIHKSTSQSVKNEDGSFNLSNTLQLESAPSETEYCCTLNNTKIPSRQPASKCWTLEHARASTFEAKDTRQNMTGTIVVVIVLVISLVSILFGLVYCRTGRKNYLVTKFHFKQIPLL